VTAAPAETPVDQLGANVVPRILAGAPLRGLGSHLERWGVLPATDRRLIAEAGRAGLRGRGGSGFPMAEKLAAVAAGRRRPVVVVNATEGEPASAKDRTLLSVVPHLVLDGADAAAGALRATEVIVCVDRASRDAVAAIERAADERRRAGLNRVRTRVEATPSGYLTGQETALVHWLNSGVAAPTTLPPRPSQRGVAGRPTLVNNAETFAQLALVARFGAQWYRGLGTDADPGTALFTVSGAVDHPGVYEAVLGSALSDLIDAAGGRPSATSAILLGGYYGTWLPVTSARTPLAFEPLRRIGASMGAGVVIVLPAGSCGLAEVARVTRWLAGQSAGQCGPCVHGLPAISAAVDALVAGERTGTAQRQLVRWLDMVEGRGACGLPDGTARFVRSALATFEADIERHRRHGPCRTSPPVLELPRRGGAR
jgi:NADH:ubiquinone oxidoreductase subunit F (NADH-binding)